MDSISMWILYVSGVYQSIAVPLRRPSRSLSSGVDSRCPKGHFATGVEFQTLFQASTL